MQFIALETSLQLIRALRRPISPLRLRDPKLHDQIRRAASSISLNLAEGAGRSGKDRRRHYRIAAGSAEEVRVALRVAEAWGELSAQATAEPLQGMDHQLAMLWRLTH